MIQHEDLLDYTLNKRLQAQTTTINSDLLDQVRKIFHDQTHFDQHELSKYPPHVLVDYLKVTHHFYLNVKVPTIQQYLDLMLKNQDQVDSQLLLMQLFFQSYAENLKNHIEKEENDLFPFITNVLQSNRKTELIERCRTMEKVFTDDHSDTEVYLQKMLVILSNYQPNQQQRSIFNMLQTEIDLFAIDLFVHARIEEEVLFNSVYHWISQ